MVSRQKAIVLLLVLVASGAQMPRAQQKNQSPDPLVPTFGGVVFKLGNSIDEYRRSRAQVRAAIDGLTKQLEVCGTCADRARIQTQLDEVLAADAAERSMEADALKQIGLPGKDFSDFGRILADSIIHPEVYQQRAEVNQVRTVVGTYCFHLYDWDYEFRQLPPAERDEIAKDEQKLRAWQQRYTVPHNQCVEQNDPVVLLAHQKAAAELCYGFHDFDVAHKTAMQKPGRYDDSELKRVVAGYNACMNENDILTAMCTKDAQLEVERERKRNAGRAIPDASPCGGPEPSPQAKARVHAMQISESPVLSDAQARRLAANMVEPVFPPASVEAGTELVVQVLVDQTGRFITIEDPHNLLKPTVFGAAFNAVRQWRFQPYIKDGKPQEFRANLVFHAGGRH